MHGGSRACIGGARGAIVLILPARHPLESSLPRCGEASSPTCSARAAVAKTPILLRRNPGQS